MNSEFREPATTAVDRAGDRSDLEQIANRAKNKTAAKRARTLVRELDERLAAERAEADAARLAAETDAAERRAAELRALDEAERQAAAARAQAEAAERQRAEDEASAQRR